MNNNQIRLMGVLIRDRKSSAAQVQSLLTEHGCSIKTRLGLHEASDDSCAPHGLILLELTGPVQDMDNLEKALNGVKSVEAKVINFAV